MFIIKKSMTLQDLTTPKAIWAKGKNATTPTARVTRVIAAEAFVLTGGSADLLARQEMRSRIPQSKKLPNKMIPLRNPMVVKWKIAQTITPTSKESFSFSLIALRGT